MFSNKQIKESEKRGGKELSYEDAKISKDLYRKIVKHLPSLQSLSFSSSKMAPLTSDLAKLSSLETLTIRKCHIESIPNDWTTLKMLNSVTIEGCDLMEFPAAFFELPLVRLSLSDNKIERIHRESKGPLPIDSTLESLDLSGNALKQFGEGMCHFQKLIQLNVSQNAISSVSPEIANLRSLTSLNLSENALSSLPEEIGKLSNLMSLLLRRNRLFAIPGSIGNCILLKTLSVSENLLGELPSEICRLVNLQILHLQQNRISSLPENIGQLTNVTVLKLSQNNLSAIPNSIGEIILLSELCLEDNKLEELPVNLKFLGNLKKLHADNNRLSSLPEMTGMSQLTLLNLAGNQFVDPDEISKLRNLNLMSLSLSNNPLPDNCLKFMQEHGALAFVQENSEDQKKISEGTIHVSERKTRRSTIKESSWRAFRASLSRSNTLKKSSSHVSMPDIDSSTSDVEPPWEDFQVEFESLMNELEFQVEKREEMMNMPVKAKWKLLSHFRQTALTDSPTTSPTKTSDTPLYFSELLGSGKVTLREMTSLRIVLSSQSSIWMSQFIELKGISYMLAIIDALSFKINHKKNVKANVEVLWECLKCLRVLAKEGFIKPLLEGKAEMSQNSPNSSPVGSPDSPFTTLRRTNSGRSTRTSDELPALPSGTLPPTKGNTAVSILTHLLVHPMLKIQLEVANLLNKIAKIRSIGHGPLLESLTNFSASQKIERLSPMLDMLKIQVKSKTSETIEDIEEKVLITPIKIVALDLINNLIKNTNELEDRIQLQEEILNLGAASILDELAKNKDERSLIDHIEAFWENINQDKEEISMKFQDTKDILKSIRNQPTAFRLSAKNYDAMAITDVVIIFNGIPEFHSLGFSTKFPFHQGTLIGSILKDVMKDWKIPSDDVSYYGLYLKENSSIFLEDSRDFGSYNLSQEVVLELRLRPQRLNFKTSLDFNNFQVEKVDLDPSWDCSKILVMLISRYFVEISREIEDYGLCWIPEEGQTPQWLDDTLKLSHYQLHTKSGTLSIKRKDLRFRIYYMGGNTSETKVMDWDTPVRNLLEIATRTVNATAQIEDYQISTTIHRKKIILDVDKRLSDYKFSKVPKLRFELKPREISVKYPDESVISTLFDFSRTIRDLAEQIRSQRPIESGLSFFFQLENQEIALDMTKSLRDQNVPMGSVLILRPGVAEVPAAAQELSVWAETENSTNFILDSENLISKLSLNQLVIHMTSENKEEAAPLQAIVLVTWSNFVSADLLLRKLTERYNAPADSQISQESKRLIQQRTVNFIEKWKTQEHEAEFRQILDTLKLTDENFQVDSKLRSFARLKSRNSIFFNEDLPEKSRENLRDISRDISGREISKSFSDPLPEKLPEKLSEKISEKLSGVRSNPAVDLPAPSLSPSSRRSSQASISSNFEEISMKTPKMAKFSLFGKTVANMNERGTFFDLQLKQISQQLTLITYEHYSKLKAKELLKQNWNSKILHSPNVIGMTEQFNEVSRWVSSCIVLEDRIRDRVSLVTNFIKIAQQLEKLKNYHLLTAFLSGLNNGAVLRLKWTFKRIPKRSKQILENLEALMSMEGSFKNYRAVVSRAMPPCIPYLGVVCQDLTFVDENPDRIGTNINFDKQKIVHRIVTECLQFVACEYRLPYDEEIRKFLKSLPVLEENSLYHYSMQQEPRNAALADIR